MDSRPAAKVTGQLDVARRAARAARALAQIAHLLVLECLARRWNVTCKSWGMEFLHGADDERLPMPVFTLPPTPRYTIPPPCSVTVLTRAPSAPVSAAPALPETFWTFLARAWFFIAGVTMGVLFAAALIAIAARTAPPKTTAGAKGAHAPAAQAAPAPVSAPGRAPARKLVVVRPATAPDRATGGVTRTPQTLAPAPSRTAVRRRTAVAPHKTLPARRSSARDVLNAAL